jgi:hypothetical protein
MVIQPSFLPETDWTALSPPLIGFKEKMWGRIIDAEATDAFIRRLNFIKPEKNPNA